MTEKILLVEDCPVNRHMLAAVLRREGYDLQLAADVRRTVPLSLRLTRLGGEALLPALVRALEMVRA